MRRIPRHSGSSVRRVAARRTRSHPFLRLAVLAAVVVAVATSAFRAQVWTPWGLMPHEDASPQAGLGRDQPDRAQPVVLGPAPPPRPGLKPPRSTTEGPASVISDARKKAAADQRAPDPTGMGAPGADCRA